MLVTLKRRIKLEVDKELRYMMLHPVSAKDWRELQQQRD